MAFIRHIYQDESNEESDIIYVFREIRQVFTALDKGNMQIDIFLIS